MAKLVNATKLIPLQRGFVAGYRRDRHKARRELRALAQSLDENHCRTHIGDSRRIAP